MVVTFLKDTGVWESGERALIFNTFFVSFKFYSISVYFYQK